MTPVKKLLILGGGYADIPLIKAAKALGYYVITSGNRPDELGHHYSDQCCLEDFSDEQAMLHLAKSLQIEAVCASCNDFSALSAAYVAERLGLPGHDPYETAQTLHHKDRYRKFALENDIPSPRAEGYESIETAIRGLDDFLFPVIIKPVDLTGGKGVSIVSSLEDGATALKIAFSRSRAKRVVIEEFIEGSRHGLSIFIRDGRVIFYFDDDEYYYLNPYLVSAASTPSSAPIEAIEILCRTAERIATLLRLGTGIFHVQYILREAVPVIIEICRRPPGDLYTQFVHVATGVDYPSYIVRGAAGLDCSGLTHVSPNGYFTRHCVMAPASGIVSDITFNSSIKDNIVDQFIWWKPGDRIDDALTQKLGIVFMRFDSMNDMIEKTRQMQDLIRANIGQPTL